jgi:integrase
MNAIKDSHMSLTEAIIKNLPLSATDEEYNVYDTNTKYLVLRVGSVHKVFYVYKKIGGRKCKVKIGDTEEIPLKRAKEAVIGILEQLQKGKNPTEERRKIKQEMTLKDLFEKFMERYSRPYKKCSGEDEKQIPLHLDHWFNRRLSSITKPMVKEWFDKLSVSRPVGKRTEGGPYAANRTLERLKAMYNKAIEWGYEGANPCVGIKKNKEIKRDRFLKPGEMKRFFKAVAEESNEEARNYVLLSVLTGARRNNVLSMRWEEIDFERRVWRIPETKNGEPLEVPLVDRAISLLKSLPRSSEWVLPSKRASGRTGHLADPKKAWDRILNRAGISNLRLHDLRRTMGSYQAIMGASLTIIGKSLGHKSMEATQIYARLSEDPVRQSMETAVGKMFEYGEKKEKGDSEEKA